MGDWRIACVWSVKSTTIALVAASRKKLEIASFARAGQLKNVLL